MKRVMVWSLLILFTITGCMSSTSAGKEPKANIYGVGEITDRVELEKIWQEYIYHTTPSIANTREFNTAKEIDPRYVIQFCWLKYQDENGIDNLEMESEDSKRLLFPLETALEYAERYFDLESLDVSEIPDHDYDLQKQAFTLYETPNRSRPSYTESIRINMEKVMSNADGTVTVELARYNSYLISGRIDYTQTFTLKQREDGSLYFINGVREYINNNLVALTGDLTCFEKIEGFEGQMQDLSMVGEVDGRMILSYTPYGEEKKPSIMIMDPTTMAIEKSININDYLQFSDVKFTGKKLIVRQKYNILIYNQELELIEEIALPQIITEKIDREQKLNNMNFPEIVFNGYDISEDLSRIVYADEMGVKLVKLQDNSEKLLSETVPITGSSLIDKSYHGTPRFVANDKKVITTMSGYEGIMGYTLCDLEKETEQTLRIMEGFTGSIRYDTGLLAINASVYDEQTQTSDYKANYIDFHTGEVMEIDLEKPGDTGYIRHYNYDYVGQNYAAFITTNSDSRDSADSMHYLNRLNLKTLVIEQEIISVKATSPYLLGVLANGQIVFRYDLNPSENGVCISGY